MSSFALLTLFFVTLSVAAPAPSGLADTSVDVVRNAFIQAKIVPDVVPSFSPRIPFQVKFPQDDGSLLPVQAGTTLSVAQTKNRPVFDVLANVFPAEQITRSSFTVLMVDPDAPTPQDRSLAQIRHLVAPGFTSTTPDADGHFELTNQTVALADYFPPGPPPGSPPHRYTLLLYLQEKAISAPPDFKPNDASVQENLVGFNATQFADEVGGLTLIGGTFFLVGPDAGSDGGASSSGGNGTTAPPPTGANGSGNGNNCVGDRSDCVRIPVLGIFICP